MQDEVFVQVGGDRGGPVAGKDRDERLRSDRKAGPGWRVFVIALAALILLPAWSAMAAGGADCRESTLAVKLTPLSLVATEQIFMRLCVPAGERPATIQVVVHGIMTGSLYWDFPDPTNGTDRYSYVSAATRAGYATLNIDRIGIGKSSHPLGLLLDFNTNAFAVHQVIQALREGRIPGPAGSVRYPKVALVGHSYGSIVAWFVASDWPDDVDGVVLSAATHRLPLDVLLTILLSSHLALLDPTLDPPVLDPTYLTTIPGKRQNLFYAPAFVDPAVLALDEQTKQTESLGEADSILVALASPLDLRDPVLLANGDLDALFCLERTGADCTSAEGLVETEAAFLGIRVPCVDGFILEDAGHAMNLMENAEDWFAAAQQWVQARVANPDGTPGSCAGAF